MSDTPEQIQIARPKRAGAGSSSEPKRSTVAVNPLAYPLDEFYAQTGQTLPNIESINGALLPEPYKSLLVHNDDMTPTLENFYGSKVHLEVLRRQQRDHFYFRQVLLLLDNSEQPVEFGAIKINLALFPAAARREILEEQFPLGRILSAHSIAHHSRPKAFLKIDPDAYIRSGFNLRGKPVLYGRRNTLVDPTQRSLAEILEVLPPARKFDRQSKTSE